MKSNVIGLGILSLLICACSPAVEQQNSDMSIMMEYQDSEPGIDPYVTRILVNNQFVRMDDGVDNSDYTLYDRANKKVYTVSHENEKTLELTIVSTKAKVDRKLKMDAARVEDDKIPSVNGKKPRHYRLSVNGANCTDLIAVKGMLPEAMNALAEFRRTMVNVHLTNLVKTPPEFQDECFLAHDIVAPSRTLQFGFPVFAQHANGQKRVLMNFNKAFKVSPTVYELPKDYPRSSR